MTYCALSIICIVLSRFVLYCSEDILCAEHLVWSWEPGDIVDMLGLMTAANCKVDVVSGVYRATVDSDDLDGNESDHNSDEDDDESDDESDDDSEEEDDDDDDDLSQDNGNHNRSVISREQLIELYEGPPRWKHLICPPLDSSSTITLCLSSGGSSGGSSSGSSSASLPCMMSHCVACYSSVKSTNNNEDGVTTDNTEREPFFGTKYWLDALPTDLISLWSKVKIDPRHHFPQENQYLPALTSIRLISELQYSEINCNVLLTETTATATATTTASTTTTGTAIIASSASTTSEIPGQRHALIKDKVPELIIEQNGLKLFHL